MLLAAVRLSDGVVAPMVLDGPVTGASFAGYVERSLVPELRLGDIVACGAGAVRPRGIAVTE
jgi:hypothetical protein